eukprot:Sdes_comp19862_c0_seq1m12123
MIRSSQFACAASYSSDIYREDLYGGSSSVLNVPPQSAGTFTMSSQKEKLVCDQYRPLAACCALLVSEAKIMSFNITMRGSVDVLIDNLFDITLSLQRTNFPLLCASSSSLYSACSTELSNYCFTLQAGELCDGTDPASPVADLKPYGPSTLKPSDLNDQQVQNCSLAGGSDGWGYLTEREECLSGYNVNSAIYPYYCVRPGTSSCATCLVPELYMGTISSGALICPQSVYDLHQITVNSDYPHGQLLTTPVLGARLYVQNLKFNCSGHDYQMLLGNSLYFFEAQRSGELPLSSRIPFRNHSGLQDGHTVDLTGGYYDAGDYVKFNFPAAWSLTMMSWGFLENPDAYVSSGQLYYLLDAIKWGLDYLIKSNSYAYKYYGMVQDPDQDHRLWGRIEDYLPSDESREGYYVTEKCPGSDLTGETAAALAAGSMVFQYVAGNDGNSEYLQYASTLRYQAVQSMLFANSFQGKYSACINETRNFYGSSGFIDELAWGSLWLYKLTMDSTWLEDATKYWKQGLEFPGTAFSWDDKTAGVHVLFSQLTNQENYIEFAKKYIYKWLCQWPGNSAHLHCDIPDFYQNYVSYTPGGLAFFSNDGYGNTRYAMNTAWLSYTLASYLESQKRDADDVSMFREWADSQLEYVLGNNPEKVSLVVGLDAPAGWPKYLHHRESSCPNQPTVCDSSYLNSTNPNPQILYGALVGGPDVHDQFLKYTRADFRQNEPAMDYNAGITNVFAHKLGTSCSHTVVN